MICAKCKNPGEFYKNQSVCIECQKAYQKRRNSTDEVKRYKRDLYYQKTYGITLDKYEEMLAAQDGVCYICKQECRRKLCIDHDHKTGEVRKLLCDRCNNLLGRADDDVDLLRAAALYVEEHK